MSLDYPNRAEWLAKRNNPVAGSLTHGRIVWSQGTFRRRRPGPTHVGKSELRALKKARMEQMYRDFVADEKNMEDVFRHKFAWGLDLCRRLVRDTVLGYRSQEVKP